MAPRLTEAHVFSFSNPTMSRRVREKRSAQTHTANKFTAVSQSKSKAKFNFKTYCVSLVVCFQGAMATR